MLVLLAMLAFLAAAAEAATSKNLCRCQPHEPCWPSDLQWQALNTSIQGNLVAIRPVAYVCHDPTFNEAACEEVETEWHNSSWRATQPGAVQWENWEAWPEKNQTCYIETPLQEPCGQGRISLYSAMVKSAAHIQEAVRFAQQYNLRLVVRNSGHDFLGRSTAPYSLQILTYGLKDVQFVDDFVPAGAPKNTGEGPAATIAAGVNLQELYSMGWARGLTVVGGAAYTVGIAGGYIQGGGHSPLGTWKGMASDNALEFKVVTAKGDLLTANLYQNADLFWALRGGGGGTFGVVVSVTVRTFPDAPAVVALLNITSAAGNPQFWDAITELHAQLPTLNGGGGAGYYYLTPNLNVNGSLISSMSMNFYLANETETAKIDALFAPLLSKLKSIASVKTDYNSLSSPNTAPLIKALLSDDSNTTGYTTLVGSRLFSRDLLLSQDGPARLVSVLSRLEPVNLSFTGCIVAGGAVAANGATVDSGLNPAWRKAIIHIVYGRGWSVGATLAEQRVVQDNLTNVEVPLLKSVEGPDKMGAYVNEADAYEPDFQQSFWGDNYPRLYSLKQKWDPEGLFIVRRGVGSENWDDSGLCQLMK